MTRRNFLNSALALQVAGERPARDSRVEVMNPRTRTPLSWIIDDSTCLVNLNRFAIPQFRAAWDNTRYEQDWRSMPHEIPDDFVRRFAGWCAEHGVKGKYSIVPFPACVGRVDRELPGWTREELRDSLKLVRDRMLPHWDIHPEMVTHTRVIDTRTGHPYEQRTPEFMENWRWCGGKSAEQIAEYVAYALRILKNAELPCEGVTSPGGFGSDAKPEYSKAVLMAVREVFGTEVPHYFLQAIGQGDASVMPRVENAAGLDTSDPRCIVSIVSCTGDWTGNWDCSTTPDPDRYISADLQKGRVPEIIARGEPAVLLSHWTGIHFNGRELGFQAFRQVVERLQQRYGKAVQWMKLRDIARYWAARELTALQMRTDGVEFRAPYACPDFTVKFKAASVPAGLREVRSREGLESNTWLRERDSVIAVLSLPRGRSELRFA